MSVEKAIITHKEERIMTHFLMFFAPFIVLIGGIAAAFIVAPMDGAVRKQVEEER